MSILTAVLALVLLSALFGTMLVLASRVFKVETDPKEAAVRSCLAGANCGACGYPGCDGYAAAVARGEAPVNCCGPGGEETAKKIAEIMGLENADTEAKKAFVACSGICGRVRVRFHYNGPQDCNAAMLFGGRGDKQCTFACIGLGSCVKACQFEALHMEDGIAKINWDKCVGCGACAKVCPKDIIKLIPVSRRYAVACSSKGKGVPVMKVCDAGCIGCMKCQHNCPNGAIYVENNLARIDHTKCVGCGICAEVCPRGIIRHLSPTDFDD